MKSKKTDKEAAPRTVLVILSNRFNRVQAAKYFQLVCEADGTVLEENELPEAPDKAIYDEVWENDEGKTSMDSCRSMKRKYDHALQKPA